MFLLRILLTGLVYIILIYFGIKFYFWSRRQQKKYAGKWTKRFGLLLFFAPILILLLELLLSALSIPESYISWLKQAIGAIDYTLAWIQSVVKPVVGDFMYFVLKPAITALVYAIFGGIIGEILDLLTGKSTEEAESEHKEEERK